MKKPEWCKSRICKAASAMMGLSNDRGFCCGILSRPYKNSHPDDIIQICFIDGHYKERFLMTPAETLFLAAVTTSAIEQYKKPEKEGVK